MSTKWAISSVPYRFHLKENVIAGPLLMVSSAFLFAVLDCIIKVLGPRFQVWDIAFYRFACGMIILFMVFGRHRNPFRGHNTKLLIFRGIVGSMAFMSLVVALRMIPISTALVLFYAYPAFAALFSALLFKERLSKDLLWVLVALGGVAVFFDFRLEGGLLGQFLSLVGAAFAGVAVACIKKLRETNGPVIIYFYFCIIGATISLAPFLSDPHLPVSPREWLLVGGLAIVSLVAQLLMNQGFHYCKSWEGGVFLTSEVIFVSLWGTLFLEETVTWHFWLGGPMIVGSIIALNLSHARKLAPTALSPLDG